MSIEDILYEQYGSERKAGEVVFREGDEGLLVYLIQSGRIQIAKKVAEREKVLAVLSRGDFFGEMALVSDRPRSATAVVLEDCRLLVLDRDLFFRILRSSYEITSRIIEQLSRRLADADKRLEVLLFTDAIGRLVSFLEGIGEGPATMDRAQLAYELGVPVDRLERITSKLEEKGIISFKPEGLVVLDRVKLDKLKGYLLLKEEFGPMDEDD